MVKKADGKKSEALREQARKLMEQAAQAEREEMEELGRAVFRAMKKSDGSDAAIMDAVRGLYPEWKPGKNK